MFHLSGPTSKFLNILNARVLRTGFGPNSPADGSELEPLNIIPAPVGQSPGI